MSAGRGPGSSGGAVRPHPELSRYYRGEQEHQQFVRKIFDDSAPEYDRLVRMVGFGTGSWYRRRALKRAGLGRGMRVLDVAVGTGLVAREAARLVGNPRRVVGIDPSRGMLVRAVASLGIGGIIGVGERLPLADQSFDFVSMGYAIRHLPDLRAAFGESYRVLRPGGVLCMVEFCRPTSRWGARMLRCYLNRVVPALSRLTLRDARTQLLWRYTADTIETLVEPGRILDALALAGFERIGRNVDLGMFAAYCARRPDAVV